MKRAFFLAVAALIVLASLPSTHTLADTSKQLDSKNTPQVVTKGGTGTIGPPLGTGDDGDADDIAGIKGTGSLKRGFGGSSQDVTIRVVLNMWWNWMVMIR